MKKGGYPPFFIGSDNREGVITLADTQASTTKMQENIKTGIKWLIPFLLGLGIYLYTDSLNHSMRLFFAFTLWGVFAWVFEILPEALVAIMLCMFFIIAGIGKPSIIFSPWGSAIPWLTFGGIVLSMAMSKTGLAKRIAYKILIITGTTLPRIVAGLVVTGLILAPLISSPSAKVLLMAPIIIGIMQALNVKPLSKTAACLMTAVLLAVWTPNFIFLSSNEGLMAAEAARKVTGEMISFTDYMIHMSPLAILWTICSAFSIVAIKPDKVVFSAELLKRQYKEMGSMTREQITCIVLFVIMLILFLTDKYHRINPAWIIVLIASVCFFPGINILKKEDLSKANFLILIFVTGAMAIGEAANQCGATELFTKTVVEFLQGQSESAVIIAAWLISLLGNFILTPVAIMGGFFNPTVNIFSNLGLNPLLGPYSMILGFSHFLFPYEMAPALVAYSFGYIKLQDMIKILAFRMVLGLVFMFVVVIPYWKMIGLL